MTPEQFCYWLQGRVEMQPDNPPSADEWRMIGEHLATVFNKVTPDHGRIFPSPADFPPLSRDYGLKPLRAECAAPPSTARTYC